MLLKDDPRLDPKLGLALKQFELDGEAPPAPVDLKSSEKERLQFINDSEPLYQGLFGLICPDKIMPGNVSNDIVTIEGIDQNQIPLFISKPNNVKGDVPAILHIHGGGMAILSATDTNYVSWRNSIASKGIIVIGVEFRNIGGSLGNHPFPAGLNDCMSALKWLCNKKQEMGTSKIILSGESGGGNLTLATTLKAQQDGIGKCIDGVYAQCPYISNLYTDKDQALPSLVENDSYFLNTSSMGVMASLYDGAKSKNPLAWPYYVPPSMLKGLPPHVISVNELDPLRDEGIAYYQKLKEANIKSELKIIKGTTHAAEVLFPKYIPEIFQTVIQEISDFAFSVE